MLSVYELKRIIFGWMVDFLCWDGLNDFLLTLNSESIMRTQDLLNGCLSSPILMADVPYRRRAADFLRFVMKICNGNNSTVNDKCQITILETAIDLLNQLKLEIPGLAERVKELEVQLRIHAVLICCYSGNFTLAGEVYERLDLESLFHSKLITERDKVLLKDLHIVLMNEDVNHELLKSYSYNSFILTWIPVFRDVFNSTREPHLVEMCKGMIGNKLIAFEAKPAAFEAKPAAFEAKPAVFESASYSDSECSYSPEIKSSSSETSRSTFVKKVEKALHRLNMERDTLRRQKPKTLGKLNAEKKQKLLTKIQKRLQTFAVLDAVKRLVPDEDDVSLTSDETVSITANEVENEQLNCNTHQEDSSNSVNPQYIPIRECRVLCTPLEHDKTIPLALRNLCLRHTNTADRDPNTRLTKILEDDNAYYGVESAVSKLFDQELSEDTKTDDENNSEIEKVREANRSDTIYEPTPVSKMPKLVLNMGDIWARRTTLTPSPPRKSPIRSRKRKLKVPWTSEEEDKLYAGVRLYKTGNWERIRWQFDLSHRTSTNLSDKWRNLKGNSAKMEILRKKYLKKLALEANIAVVEDSPLF